MYQCVRQASVPIAWKSITASPRLRVRLAPRFRAVPAWARGPSVAAASHEHDEREAREDDRHSDQDRRERRLGALGRPEELPGDGAAARADLDRDLPVEDQGAPALVLDLRRRRR